MNENISSFFDESKRYFNLQLQLSEKAKEINRKGAKDFYLRTKKDPKYILLRTLRSRLGGIFKNIKNQKKPKTLQLLGCSIKVLKKHIEAKFKEGM